MTNKKAAKILAARIECKRCIYRNCDECELCYAQGTFKELIEAVVIAIKALEQPRNVSGKAFTVIDMKTCKEAVPYDIALNEDWAKKLMYCDMEGFAIKEDGALILIDECGNYEYCPNGRFEVVLK